MSNPLTREEVESDAFRANVAYSVEERTAMWPRLVALLDERDDLAAQLSEMGRQRDLAIQQAIDEETKHRKWTDDRNLLAKDLAAAREELAFCQRLPQLPWAEVCASIMQRLAALARAGYQPDAQSLMKVLDKGKTFVVRIEAERDKARAELAKVLENAIHATCSLCRRGVPFATGYAPGVLPDAHFEQTTTDPEDGRPRGLRNPCGAVTLRLLAGKDGTTP